MLRGVFFHVFWMLHGKYPSRRLVWVVSVDIDGAMHVCRNVEESSDITKSNYEQTLFH